MALQKHTNLFLESVSSILRNPGRSLVVFFCLTGVLLPFVAALAVSQGVRAQATVSIAAGADLYVCRSQYGRNGPVALSEIERIEKMPGVIRVVPRIVGRTYLGEELAVVVGIDAISPVGITGSSPPPESNQILIGRSLAERLGLSKGDDFHFSLFPALPFTVAGYLEPNLSLWSASMVVISYPAAAQVFKLPDMASELLVYCRPGTADRVAEELSSIGKPWDMTPPLRVQTKSLVERYVQRGFGIQAGTFSMLYVTAFGLAIPALLILSGLGRGQRRQEIGIMKATGWQTLEIMEMMVFENILLALMASLMSLTVAMLWLKLGNGIGIAQLFISGSGLVPDFPVPSRFTPLPALFAFLFGLVLTLLGTMISTWRAAVTPPLTTMG